MKFRIHFEWPDGTEDSLVLSGETIDEIREKARVEIEERSGKNTWSEEIKE